MNLLIGVMRACQTEQQARALWELVEGVPNAASDMRISIDESEDERLMVLFFFLWELETEGVT